MSMRHDSCNERSLRRAFGLSSFSLSPTSHDSRYSLVRLTHRQRHTPTATHSFSTFRGAHECDMHHVMREGGPLITRFACSHPAAAHST